MQSTPSYPAARPGQTSAAAYRAAAPDLADWVWRSQVNRTDVFGGYLPLHRRGKRTLPDGREANYLGPITRPARSRRGKEFLTLPLLVRHFEGSAVEDVLGLHSTSPDNTSRWGGVDIDWHGPDSTAPETNLRAALAWYAALRRVGFSPLLTDSNGKGGYHLRFLLSAPAPTPLVYAFLRRLVSDYAEYGMTAAPECFPKQPRVQPGRYGNWLRLPGRHHTRDHWSRVWDGAWLEGPAAVAFLLALAGDSPALIPAGLPAPGRRDANRNAGPATTPPSPTALTRRIAAYMARLPNRSEGQGRDDVAFNFGSFLARDLALPDEVALRWLEEWDRHNTPPKGRDRLAEILANVHLYGERAYGSGLDRPLTRRPSGHDTIAFSFTVEVPR